MDTKQEEQLNRERVEVGGPYPSVTVIRCVDGGYIGPNGCEPPQYEPICVVHQNPEGDYETQPPSEAIAIAERLAACWNYCRGIPTAALEGEAKSVIDLLREARTWVADGCEYQSTEAAARALLDRIDAALAAGEKR